MMSRENPKIKERKKYRIKVARRAPQRSVNIVVISKFAASSRENLEGVFHPGMRIGLNTPSLKINMIFEEFCCFSFSDLVI